jgi:hypothetical protein
MGPPAVYAAFVADLDAHMKATIVHSVRVAQHPTTTTCTDLDAG